jgi:metaxin
VPLDIFCDQQLIIVAPVDLSLCTIVMPQKNDDPRRVLPPFFEYFQLPALVKRIFDNFPLKTYPPNELPRRSPQIRDEVLLHIFTTKEAASNNAPSFNPTCLKWQVRNNSE